MKRWKDPSEPYEEICEKLYEVQGLISRISDGCDISSTATIIVLLNTLYQLEKLEQFIDKVLPRRTTWDCITCNRLFSHTHGNLHFFAPSCLYVPSPAQTETKQD